MDRAIFPVPALPVLRRTVARLVPSSEPSSLTPQLEATALVDVGGIAFPIATRLVRYFLLYNSSQHIQNYLPQ